jgi:hypothetical protein
MNSKRGKGFGALVSLNTAQFRRGCSLSHTLYSLGAALLGGQTGCVAHKHTYKVTGHEMGIRMLSADDLNSYAVTTWQPEDERAKKFNDRLFEVYRGPSVNLEPVTTAAAASFVAGVVVDYVKARLDAESKKYEAQFTAWQAKPSFWEIVATTDGTNKSVGVKPRWAGVEVVRWTHSSPVAGKEPAFRLVAVIQQNPEDNRWFNIVPVFFQTREAKAKLAFWNSKMTSNIKLGITASWVKPDLNSILDQEVGRAEWEVSGYDIDTRQPMYFSDKDHPGGNPFVAGTFAAPPLSFLDDNYDGKPDQIALGQIPTSISTSS